MKEIETKRHFLVCDNGGRRKSYLPNEAVAMVLDAARYDGYGAVFDRDSGGAMRLFFTIQHIGNNPMPALDSDIVFSSKECSRIEEESMAQLEVAQLIVAAGLIHGRWTVDCEEVVCDKLGNVVRVSKINSMNLMEDLDTDQAGLNSLYGKDAG